MKELLSQMLQFVGYMLIFIVLSTAYQWWLGWPEYKADINALSAMLFIHMAETNLQIKNKD